MKIINRTFWKICILFLVSSELLMASEKMEKMSLSQALEMALANNPHIAMIKGQREAADAKVWEAKGAFLPQILVSAGYTRYEEPNIIVPIHQVGVFPPLDDQIYESSLQVKIPLLTADEHWQTIN